MKRKCYFWSSGHEPCAETCPLWVEPASSFPFSSCVFVFCLLLHTQPVSSHSQTQSEHAQSGCFSRNSKMFMNTNEAAARPPAPQVCVRHCEALISFQRKLNMSGSVVCTVWGEGMSWLHLMGVMDLFVNVRFCCAECYRVLLCRLKSHCRWVLYGQTLLAGLPELGRWRCVTLCIYGGHLRKMLPVLNHQIASG